MMKNGNHRWVFKKGLPRAKLLTVKITESWWKERNGRFPPRRWAYFRYSNAASLWVWRVVITWRMPWILAAAEQLHADILRGKKDGMAKRP